MQVILTCFLRVVTVNLLCIRVAERPSLRMPNHDLLQLSIVMEYDPHPLKITAKEHKKMNVHYVGSNTHSNMLNQ